MSTIEVRVTEALRFLCGRPVDLDAAAKGLSRGSGVYAWWAVESVFPQLPGRAHPDDPGLRALYVGRATSLRGRILRNHLRRSGSSTLRRTLAGLLMPTEHYQTMWTDRVVLRPEDELRLTDWMQFHLGLTWAEDPAPAEIEAELVRRLRPMLNVSGVEADQVPPSVLAAKESYQASAVPPAGSSPEPAR